ncbi:outer membrane protein [Consotaella aegiceratis]|uniref:outer membrane protein n=1 Tax=Consotaella aegiceratis TaxID=3097961 RepID=UPI002F402EB2
MRALRALSTAAAFFTLSGSTAFAADVVLDEAPAPAPMIGAAPIQVWTGPYAGAFVGYNFSDVDQSGGADFDGEGFVGGVYTGYNWQAGSLVYGVEGDIGYAGFDAGGFNSAADSAIEMGSNVFGSLRARAGYAFDPFMVFATGGVAVANKEMSLGGDEDDQTHVGYTVGGGVEANLTDKVTSRLEYRYSDFDDQDYTLGGTTVSSGFDEHSIRAGVALKF